MPSRRPSRPANAEIHPSTRCQWKDPTPDRRDGVFAERVLARCACHRGHVPPLPTPWLLCVTEPLAGRWHCGLHSRTKRRAWSNRQQQLSGSTSEEAARRRPGKSRQLLHQAREGPPRVGQGTRVALGFRVAARELGPCAEWRARPGAPRRCARPASVARTPRSRRRHPLGGAAAAWRERWPGGRAAPIVRPRRRWREHGPPTDHRGRWWSLDSMRSASPEIGSLAAPHIFSSR